MRKTTTNKLPKHAAKTGYRFTLLAGALLVLIGLPTLGVAGQQMQIATLDSTISPQIVFGSAEDYGDTQQEEEDWSGSYAPNAGKTKSDLLSKHSARFELVASNDQQDGGEQSGYGEIVLDED